MTIKEYVQGLAETEKKFKGITEQMLDTVQVWDNSACKGYCLKAMQNANLDAEQIQEVLKELSYCFNDLTNQEAEDFYNNYCPM